MSTVTTKSDVMEKTKKTKSRTGCRMCKTKRLKCDETKPACNQCVRRGRLCPGYKREYKWSTISTLTGKTRPPADEPYSPEKDQIAFSNVAAEVPVPSLQNASSSGLEDQHETVVQDEQSYLLSGEDATYTDIDSILHGLAQDSGGWADTTCTTNLGEEVVNLPGSDTAWPEWNPESEVFVSSADDAGGIDAIGDTSTDLATFSAVFADSPAKREDDTALIRSRSSRTVGIPSPNPVDLPTTLIEYWFTHVCSMWCAYDSPQNWYRNLAGDTWHTSEPVYYALQAMSASVLVDSLPHLKQALQGLTAQAARSIQRAADASAASPQDQAKPIPADLLLAVMGMGTSICWSDPRQLGFWFLDKARGLLKPYDDESEVQLDLPGQQTVEYFRQALIYWEMLANVVTTDYQSILQRRRSKFKKRIRRAMSMNESSPRNNSKAASMGPGRLTETVNEPLIHPWTGISGDIQQTFGLVMGLCQNRCVSRHSDTNPTADSLCDALCDIELAHDLERELLGFDFVADQHNIKVPPSDTGDPNAPLSHLVDTAEAYRLASLLNLYLAFSDLEVKSLRGTTSSSPEDDSSTSWAHVPSNVNRDQALIMLTLQLVDVLKRVPADSGTRCIQPILLISAAAGLKFDVPAQTSNDSKMAMFKPIHARGTMINQAALSDPKSFHGQMPDLSNPLDSNAASPETIQLTSLTLEVSAARRFVVNRLGALQQSLPPRPIGVALALVRAVWFNYDSTNDKLRGMHWMNTMVNSGLQTLFG